MGMKIEAAAGRERGINTEHIDIRELAVPPIPDVLASAHLVAARGKNDFRYWEFSTI